MNKTETITLSGVDKCIENLTSYISVRISSMFMCDEEPDENFINLIYSAADLIRARAKIDKTRKVATEVEIPDFLNK